MFSKTNDISQKILYNYYDTTLYLNTYEKSIARDGFVKLPFLNSKGNAEPNLILPSTSSTPAIKTKTTNLSIYKNNNENRSLDSDGILVIEHKPLTNSDSTTYVIILLKTEPAINKNTIDIIIEGSVSPNPSLAAFNLNLNQLLSYSNNTCYYNEKQNIILFETPILVNSSFERFSNSNTHNENPIHTLFDETGAIVTKTQYIHTSQSLKDPIQNRDQDGIHTNTEKLKRHISVDHQIQISETPEKIVEGLKEQIYIECNPAGSSADTMPMQLIDGTILKNISSASITNTAMYFMIFLIMAVFAVFITPFSYEYMIIGMVKNTNFTEREKAGSLKTLDMIFGLIIMSLILALSLDGMKKNNVPESMMGIFIFIFFIISIAVLRFKKMSDPVKYSLSADSAGWDVSVLADVGRFCIANIFNIMKVYIVIVIILLISAAFVKAARPKDKYFGSFFGILTAYGFVAAILLSYSFSKKKVDNTPNNQITK